MVWSFEQIGIAAAIGLGALALGLLLGRRLRRNKAGDAQARLDRLGARQLLEQLANMTDAITSGVNTQRGRIEALYGRLQQLEKTGHGSTDDWVQEVVSEIRAANEKMHDQVTVAEIQLQQQAALIESHVSQAMTDSLTRLPNRRALDEDLDRRFAAWQRRGTPISLMLVDIDHFKLVNDTYGHAAGDKVLRQAAATLRRSLRSMDLVARYGGEEFAVVLPETIEFEAQAAARHVLSAMEMASFPVNEGRLRVTVSIGIASVRHDELVEDLVRRADEALYASKHGGRNCAHYHDGVRCVRIPDDLADLMSPDMNSSSPKSVSEAIAELDHVREQLRSRVAEVTNPVRRAPK